MRLVWFVCLNDPPTMYNLFDFFSMVCTYVYLYHRQNDFHYFFSVIQFPLISFTHIFFRFLAFFYSPKKNAETLCGDLMLGLNADAYIFSSSLSSVHRTGWRFRKVVKKQRTEQKEKFFDVITFSFSSFLTSTQHSKLSRSKFTER